MTLDSLSLNESVSMVTSAVTGLPLVPSSVACSNHGANVVDLSLNPDTAVQLSLRLVVSFRIWLIV